MSFYLHKEWRGLNISSPYPLKRAATGLPTGRIGTSVWCVGRATPSVVISMKDYNGNDAPFYIDRPRLLETGGHLMIRHRSIPVPGYGPGGNTVTYGPSGTEYAIAAHGRVHLLGPFENDNLYDAVSNPGGTPNLNWANLGTQLLMNGQNIRDPSHHYANPNLATQWWIEQPGYYRLQVYAAAQTDAYDVDYLAEMSDYNQENIHQFWVRVY